MSCMHPARWYCSPDSCCWLWAFSDRCDRTSPSTTEWEQSYPHCDLSGYRWPRREVPAELAERIGRITELDPHAFLHRSVGRLVAFDRETCRLSSLLASLGNTVIKARPSMFRLNKWYLDVVSDTGDMVILYWACVEWGPFRLNYGASLNSSQSKESVHLHTFRPGTMPVVSNGVIEWSCVALNVSGAWTSRVDKIECTLTDEPRGSIRWNCASPSAYAKVNIDGDTIEGLGYVEHLTMTLKPWQLPFHELRWGRFLSPSDSLIWIQWSGLKPRTWIWLNGVEQQSADVTEDRVEMADSGIVLDLHKQKVVRSGYLNTTAVGFFRSLSALIPGWRSAHETKWLARAALNRPERAESGWAVHEVVRWP